MNISTDKNKSPIIVFFFINFFVENLSEIEYVVSSNNDHYIIHVVCYVCHLSIFDFKKILNIDIEIWNIVLK